MAGSQATDPRRASAADPAQAGTPAPVPESFEQAIEELEALVRRMEGGALSLEDSLSAYRRGTELATFCRQALARVQQQVRVLEGDLLKVFEEDGEGAS